MYYHDYENHRGLPALDLIAEQAARTVVHPLTALPEGWSEEYGAEGACPCGCPGRVCRCPPRCRCRQRFGAGTWGSTPIGGVLGQMGDRVSEEMFPTGYGARDSDESELSAVEEQVLEVGEELDELEERAEEEAEQYGLVMTVLGIAGLASMSKRIEGRLRSVKRRLDRLSDRIRRSRPGPRRDRLAERANLIAGSIADLQERAQDVVDDLQDAEV